MYAYDLIVFFLGSGEASGLSTVMRVVRKFAEFSGLRVNLQKIAGIVSNIQPEAWWSAMRSESVEVKHFMKYLGIRPGNMVTLQQREEGFMGLTIEQAFSLAIQESFRRARIASTLSLTLIERALLLKIWILPVMAWTAKAYYPPHLVTRQLALVYKLALRESDRGLTFPILSQPHDRGGGTAPPPPPAFLWHQAAYPFVQLIKHPEHFLPSVREHFKSWCGKIGLSHEPRHLPFIHLSMVRTASLSFIAWAAKAFSLLRRQAPLFKPPTNVSELPIWHKVFCRNEHKHTYYCSPLISQGVTTWGIFYGEHHPRNHRMLPRKEIFDLPDTWALCWGEGMSLQFVSPDPDTLEQQPNWVWEEWVRAKFHLTTKEFVQRALWHKLMVHDRIFTLTATTDGPLCGKKETIRHALSECKFYPVIFDFLNKSWGPTKSVGSVDDPDDHSTDTLNVKDMAQLGREFHSLTEPLGQLLWVAREAQWPLRWREKEGGSATLQKFLTIWACMLAKWTSVQGWGGGGANQMTGLDRAIETLHP